ncbi:MAG: hypothetical protein ACQCXQ_02510, partial [Verrucomicrobiales bacterium]
TAGVLVCAALGALSPVLHALELRVYSEERHDRFSGFPAAPVANPGFIHQDVDLTGVGWRVGAAEPRSLTLVSPKFFIGARHYRPSVGDTVRFVAADGSIRDYTVKANHDILNDDSEADGGPKATDVSLGELVEAVGDSDGVGFQLYLNLATEAAYLVPPYHELIVLGKSVRGGNGTATAINDFFGTPLTSGGGINNTRTLEFVYQSVGGQQDDAFAEGGDSGSPSLVNVGNRGAIVGVHTAILSALGTTTTIDSFVAHPPYISQINEIMAAEGYHMTEAIPGSISLTLSAALPEVIRAGYEAEFGIGVSNDDLLNDGNNLKVSLAFPASTTGISAAGSEWLAEIDGSSVAARKGGLAAGASTSLEARFTATVAGTYDLAVGVSADEASPEVETVSIEVVESYLSWSSALADPDPAADLDSDGFSNLLEYAFGGNPEQSSVFQADGTTRLAPQVATTTADGEVTLQFIRRKDAERRALSYVLECSPTLDALSWSDAGAAIVQSGVESLSDGYERVTVTLERPDEGMFYRVAVALSEAN